MKTLLIYLLSSLWVLPSFADQQSIIIQGQMKELGKQEILFTYWENYINHDKTQYRIKLSEDGHFKLVLQESPQIVNGSLWWGENEHIDLWLQAGDSIYIQSSGPNPAQQIQFSGKGKEKCEYALAYEQQFRSIPTILFIYKQAEIRDVEAYSLFLDSLYQEKVTLLTEWKTKEVLPTEFVSYYEQTYRYRYFEDKLRYGKRKQRKEETLPATYFAFMDQLPDWDDSYLMSSSYCYFISSYAAYQYDLYSQDIPKQDRMSRYDHATQLFSGKTLAYRRAVLLNRDISQQQRLEAFLAEYPYEDLKQILFRQQKRMKETAIGALAYDFELENLAGEKLKLSDFRGKVVYIDFCASFCGFCREEFEPANKLKQTLPTDEVVFIYISQDRDRDLWKKTVSEFKLAGTHLYDDGLTGKRYNVHGTPSYFVIGKEGQILANNETVKRPSNPELKAFLLEAITQ